MACMEHLCVGCGEIVLNNISRFAEPCIKCGSTRWASMCDEDFKEIEAEVEDSYKDD